MWHSIRAVLRAPLVWRALGAALLLLAAGAAEAQTTNSYRSRVSGFWDQTSTWQRYNGSGWVAATETPGTTNAATISVRNGHTVTIRNALTANEIVVNAGGKMVVNASLTLQDGSGHELTVYGTAELYQTIFVPGISSVAAYSGAYIDIPNGVLQFEGDSRGDFYAGSEMRIGRFLNLTSDNGLVRFHGGSLVRTLSSGGIDNRSDIEMGGTLINEGFVSVTTEGSLVVQNGGVYRHARNGGALPAAARTTWQAGSTFEMTGFVDTLPSGLGQSFHHVTWNSPGQADHADLAGQFAAVAGNLTILDAGVYKVDWNRTGGKNLAVGGNYIQTGGRFVFDYVGTGTMTVTGNVSMTGGVLWINGSTGETTLRVRGDVSLTGGSVVRSWTEGQAAVVMDGAGDRSVTASGTFTGEVKLRVENSVRATLQSPLVLNDNLEIAASARFDANGYDLSIGDDLQVFGTLVNPNRVTFTSTYGSTAEMASSAVVSIPEIVVATDGDPFQFGGEVRVTRSMMVTSGNVVSNGNRLTVAGGAVYRHARNGGSLPEAALTTWETGSTCEITGVTDALPTGLDQSYHHLIWNNPGQASSWALGLAIQAVRGDFTIGSTGTGGMFPIRMPSLRSHSPPLP